MRTLAVALVAACGQPELWLRVMTEGREHVLNRALRRRYVSAARFGKLRREWA